MDALSDVLKALRISGGIFLDAEFTAPWCVASRVGPEDFRNDDELPPSVVAFHYVIDGQMVVEVEGAPPVIVRAGEIVLLPRNNPHLLASQTGLSPLDPDPLVQRDKDGLLRMVYVGGGAPTRLVCGFVGSPVRRHPLLEALPITLTLDIKDKSCAAWVRPRFALRRRRLRPAARARKQCSPSSRNCCSSRPSGTTPKRFRQIARGGSPACAIRPWAARSR